MKRIAVLGAGGFVGARFVEFATLTGAVEVVPVIRSFKGAARLARFGPCWRRADAGIVEELGPAIANCDAVVNLTLGDFGDLAGPAVAMFAACAARHFCCWLERLPCSTRLTFLPGAKAGRSF